MAPTITMPTVPAVGLPDGEKEQGQRVDFKPAKFDSLVEFQGYRLAWTRAMECPCSAVVDEAKGQVDPNCSRCGGERFIYFGEQGTRDETDIGELSDVQRLIVESRNAMVIRGIITSVQNKFGPWDQLGNWMSGTLMVTVRPENKIGYYDRLTALDVEIPFYEIVEADGTNTTQLRYLATGLNYVITETTDFKPDIDYRLVNGNIQWITTPPTSGTIVSVHYLCHPTWLVVEHPHAARITSKKFKTPTPKTPRGDPTAMVIQAFIQYEFIPRTRP